MIKELFRYRHTQERHLAAPFVEERIRYLTYFAQQGAALPTLRTTAQYLLVIISEMNLQADGQISFPEIEMAADHWASRQPRHHKVKHGRTPRKKFISTAAQWLRFLGRLYVPQVTPPHPYTQLLTEFTDYLRGERGLAPQTIHVRRWSADKFLTRFCSQHRSLQEITVEHIDDDIAYRADHRGYTRSGIQAYAFALRTFFRYVAMRGLCTSGLAEAIMVPRLFKHEHLPLGPSWEDVERLLASTEGDRPADIRDRAILLLLVVYGLRIGEVIGLRLEDLDWEKDLILITRPKQRLARLYPLTRTVGEAILRYLKEVRPPSTYRQLFLTLLAPLKPLETASLWGVVGHRLRRLGVSVKHPGPHCLRHAFATRLLSQGLSLKEVGDMLGHRLPDTTRVYAKVDVAGLREVAEFDLGGML